MREVSGGAGRVPVASITPCYRANPRHGCAKLRREPPVRSVRPGPALIATEMRAFRTVMDLTIRQVGVL